MAPASHPPHGERDATGACESCPRGRAPSGASTIQSFVVGGAIGTALAGGAERSRPGDTWDGLRRQATELSGDDPEVVRLIDGMGAALEDLVSPAAVHLYAEEIRRDAVSPHAKALLDGMSCTASGGSALA